MAERFVPRQPACIFARDRASPSCEVLRAGGHQRSSLSFFVAGTVVGEGSRLDTMTEKRGWKAYVAVFAAIAFVSAFATSVTMMRFHNFNCRTPHDPDDFLAYCRSLGYVDYEHGALYYGLEPKVRDSIRTAQVLFLGSSRVQAAFAANALREYSKRAVSAISSWDLAMVRQAHSGSRSWSARALDPRSSS